MISELRINNYKSLHDVTLDVGRFNVLIGENGCGKSNLLEAITFAAAAEANKLDNEFLTSRGIRVTEPKLMRSAFDESQTQEPIKICITFNESDVSEKYTLENENKPYTKWSRAEEELVRIVKSAPELLVELNKLPKENIKNDLTIEKLSQFILDAYFTHDKKQLDRQYVEHCLKRRGDKKKSIEDFIIYSPENTALRNLNSEGQIEPLGVNGEGLFKLLHVIKNKSAEQWEEIHTCLQLFDWYSKFNIPKPKHTGMLALAMSRRMNITDRYLTMDFDQRSANEGFLFVLFYIALMVSDDTPKIFAIDNIDTSLNPKLCTKIIKELIKLAKKYEKQVFVTTHNPAILDGIDLGDDEQRLFVVSRNKTGHTRFKRITLKDKPKSSTNEELRLSEAFLRGYLGGLPKGF